MSVAESDRVVTITARQSKVLNVARSLMAQGTRVTEVTVANASDMSNRYVRDELAALRHLRLLPKRDQPAIAATVVVEDVSSSPGRCSAASGRGHGGSDPASVPALAADRRATKMEQVALRARFEATARDYEAVRRADAVYPCEWNLAHDRLLAAVQAYARARGAEPCICDDIAYYPNPSGNGFVRREQPGRRASH